MADELSYAIVALLTLTVSLLVITTHIQEITAGKKANREPDNLKHKAPADDEEDVPLAATDQVENQVDEKTQADGSKDHSESRQD